MKSKLSLLILIDLIKKKCWLSVYQTLQVVENSLSEEDRKTINDLLSEHVDAAIKELNKGEQK